MAATADAFFGIFGMTRMTRVEQPVILNVTVPIEVTRGQNDRGHWRTKKARTDAEKKATHVALLIDAADPFFHRLEDSRLGARVTFLRPYKPGHPLDDDNLAGAFKYPRDEVARFLGLDDASPRYCWRYVQCKGDKKRADGMHARCRVEILPASDVDPLLTAVRELKRAASELLELAKVAGYVRSATYDNAVDALATADALATFDPMELYNV